MNFIRKLVSIKLVFIMLLSLSPLSGFAQASEENKQIFFMYSTNMIPDGIKAPVPSYLKSLNDAQKSSYGSNIEKYNSLKKNIQSISPIYVGIVESTFPGFIDLFNRSISSGDSAAVGQALKGAALVNFYAGATYLASFLKSKSSLIKVNNQAVMSEVEKLNKSLTQLKIELLTLKLGVEVSDAQVKSINARYAPLFTKSTQNIAKLVSQNNPTPGAGGEVGPMGLSAVATIGVVFTAVGGVYLVLVYEAAVVLGTVFWAGIVSPHGDVSLDFVLKDIPYQTKSILDMRSGAIKQ